MNYPLIKSEAARLPVVDQVSLMDRVLLSRTSLYVGSVLAVTLGMALDIPLGWTFFRVVWLWIVGTHGGAQLPHHYLQRGLYRRALESARLLEQNWPLSQCGRDRCRLIQAYCSILLGEPE